MLIDGVDVIELLDSSPSSLASPSPPRRFTRSMKASSQHPISFPPVEEAPETAKRTRTDDTHTLLGEWKLLEEQLRCDICKQLLDVPVSLKCYHTFCSFCIRRYLEMSGNDYCPCCRVPATSTDIRLEPRLSGILSILGKDKGLVRKKFRLGIKNFSSSHQLTTNNETFHKQADMADTFRFPSSSSSMDEPVGRTLMPTYLNLKDKQLKELMEKDGIVLTTSLSNSGRDELIKIHKELVFTMQSVFDAIRMGMYQDNFPTKSGVAKIFNSELRWRDNRKNGGNRIVRNKTEMELRRENADKNESLITLAGNAQERMKDQLKKALANRKRVVEEANNS